MLELDDRIKIIAATYDFIFKAIMLDKEMKEFLKKMINYISKIPMRDLDKMILENVEYIVENKNDKKMRSDIIVSIDKSCINIEMNKDYYDGLFQKNSGYLKHIGSRLYKENEKYVDVKQAIQINFNDFSHFESKKEIHKFVMKEMETNEVFKEMGEIYHIDMVYIRKKCYNKPVSNLNFFERGCLLLTSTKYEDLVKFAGDDEILKKVANKIISLSQDEEMIGLYNAEEEERKLRNTLRYNAEKEGFAKGVSKGIAKGISKGISKGMEQQKNKEKVEIARNLLKRGIDKNIISEATSLSLEEIDKLNLKS